MADKKTILYIEDDDNIRAMIALRLEQAGFKVAVVTKGGEEALVEIKKGEHNLLLLDLGLPIPDHNNVDDPKEGFHILEQINELPPEIKNIPVIVYSNFGDNGEQKRAIGLGAREFLLKSNYTPTEIVDKIKGYLI